MLTQHTRRSVYALCMVLSLVVTQLSYACTGIRLIAKDGSVIHARTLEFATDLQSNVIVVPRGMERKGNTPDGNNGMTWKTQYASVGANALDLPIIVDGVNEAGMAIGLFYFPGYADYQTYDRATADKTIGQLQLGSWILDNFASIDEMLKYLDNIVVTSVVTKGPNFPMPVHYIVQEASGKSVVLEYVNGELNVHDNPLGVITNSPTYDWHMTNLRNYVNFSFTNAPDVKLGSVTLKPFGEGSGMLGMPGDFTPPSRFVRAAAFSQSAFPAESGNEAVLQAFHLLNNFDIPKGAVRENETDAQGNILADYTLWTSAVDQKEKAFYFRTYDNSQIRRVALKDQDLNASKIKTISMDGKEQIKTLK